MTSDMLNVIEHSKRKEEKLFLILRLERVPGFNVTVKISPVLCERMLVGI